MQVDYQSFASNGGVAIMSADRESAVGEVMELRQQLRELSDELHSLRSHARPSSITTNQSSTVDSDPGRRLQFHQQQSQWLSHSAFSPPVGVGRPPSSRHSYHDTTATSFDENTKPPALPPRRYQPPAKPLRTFEHAASSLDITDFENRPPSGAQLLSKSSVKMPSRVPLPPPPSHMRNRIILPSPTTIDSSTPLPPIVPPKSAKVLKKLVERQSQDDQDLPMNLPLNGGRRSIQHQRSRPICPPSYDGYQSESAMFTARPVTAVYVATSQQTSNVTRPNGHLSATVADPHEEEVLQANYYRSELETPTSLRKNDVRQGEETFKKFDVKGALTDENIVAFLKENFEANTFWFRCGPVYYFLNSYESAARLSPLSTPTPSSSNQINHIADQLVAGLLRDPTQATNQSVIFSGDTGAGKSWLSTQLLERLFASVTRTSLLSSTSGCSYAYTDTESYRAFVATANAMRGLCSVTGAERGTAVSRCAIWYEFHVSNGLPSRIRLNTCFVPMSKITMENRFEIFHQLLAGLTEDEKAKFHLENYVDEWTPRCGNGESRNALIDRHQFDQWKNALVELGIPLSDVLRVLAAVLLLDAIFFEQPNDDAACDVGNQSNLESVAALLGLSPLSLYKALTMETTTGGDGDAREPIRSKKEAQRRKESLVTTLYYRTVTAVVRRINSLQLARVVSSSTPAPPTDGNAASNNNSQQVSPVTSQQSSSSSNGGGNVAVSGGSDAESSARDSGIHLPTSNCYRPEVQLQSVTTTTACNDGVISVVDLFGFVDSENAKFTEFCSNFLDEKQRHFYRTKLITGSQKQMKQEGIEDFIYDWTPDNSCHNGLFTPGISLISLLNAQSSEAQIDCENETFLNGIQESKTNNTISLLNGSLLIRHYGDRPVSYRVEDDFVDANRNALPADLARLFSRQSCNFGFISYLFTADLDELNATEKLKSARIIRSCGNVVRHQDYKRSLCSDLSVQMDAMLKSLGSTNVTFINCVKSNTSQERGRFDRETVLRQIRRFDTVHTLRFVHTALPFCLDFKEFNCRYSFILKRYSRDISDVESADSDVTKLILECYLRAVDESSDLPYVSNQWAIGTDHVYLSNGAHDQLETLRRNDDKHHADTVSARRTATLPPPPLPPSHRTVGAFDRNRSERRPLSAHGYRRPSPVIDSETLASAVSTFALDVPNSVNACPPPLPPSRQYRVVASSQTNGALNKMCFPQRRVVVQASEQLRVGDIVTVSGVSGSQLLVDVGHGRQIAVPTSHTRLTVH